MALTRRGLINLFAKSLGRLAVATTGVYAVGSAFKEADGSLVAGAKVWTYKAFCSNITYNDCDPCGFVQGGSCWQAGEACEIPAMRHDTCNLGMGSSGGPCLECE